MTALVEVPVNGLPDLDAPAGAPAAGRPGPVARVLIALVRGYQLVLSTRMGGACRFEPTCSEYALEAVGTRGAFRGSGLTIYRIARCQPFCTGGYDPVPAPRRRNRQNQDDGRPDPAPLRPTADDRAAPAGSGV